MAALPAERGVRVDPSTVDARVRRFAPLYEDARPAFLRNLRGGFYDHGQLVDGVAGPPPVVRA